MSVKLVLECPAGWGYYEDNEVAAYFINVESGIRIPASSVIVDMWNSYWDCLDSPNDDPSYHAWCRLRAFHNSFLANAAESYGLRDLAADLEDIIAVKIVCYDGEEQLRQRGKEKW